MEVAKKILVVDDDPDLRQLYRDRLEAAQYTVVEATNGEEAMARAVEDKPACILLDIMMPRVNGFDVLDILKTTASTKHIPVIVLTALMQDEVKKRVTSSGAAAYLVKSEVTPNQILAAIEGLLGSPKPAS